MTKTNTNLDGETLAGCGIIGCGSIIMFCCFAVLVGLVVLVWRFALGW